MADVRDRLHGYPSRPQRFNRTPENFGHHDGAGHMEPLEDHKPVSVGEGANTTGTGVHGHPPRDFSRRERLVRRYPSSGGLTYSETRPEFEQPKHGQYCTPHTVGTFERPLHRLDFSGAAAQIERGEGSVYAGHGSQVERSAMTRHGGGESRFGDMDEHCPSKLGWLLPVVGMDEWATIIFAISLHSVLAD